jgi:phosphatidylserine/phosphatidylglycerophosphate/cardiolipin synthase-like enzyme
VLLNGGYYSEHETTNRAAVRYLGGHGLHVRYSPTYFALTHQKTLTVDDRESAILTLNFDGRCASTRDYAVIDSQPADVAVITAAFDADYADRQVTAAAGTGDLVWSPGTGAATTLLNVIDSATSSIDLENEEMAYARATSALCAAARRGVDVKVVMTGEDDWSARSRGCAAAARACTSTTASATTSTPSSCSSTDARRWSARRICRSGRCSTTASSGSRSPTPRSSASWPGLRR